MIRRAVETDLPTLLEITDACAADMKNTVFSNGMKPTPIRLFLERTLKKRRFMSLSLKML